jgi:hypothetical protein
MKTQRRFMKRMMVVLMGVILTVVSLMQIAQNQGQIWLNVIFAFLGLFEIGLAIWMMILEKKTAKE